jgi:hypothetical protein
MDEKENLTIIETIASIIKGNQFSSGHTNNYDAATKIMNYLVQNGMLRDTSVLVNLAQEVINKLGHNMSDDPNRTVPAVSFVALLEANVENERLSDKDFREFVYNTLPIIIFPSNQKTQKESDE